MSRASEAALQCSRAGIILELVEDSKRHGRNGERAMCRGWRGIEALIGRRRFLVAAGETLHAQGDDVESAVSRCRRGGRRGPERARYPRANSQTGVAG